jgi:hypothetical protein
MEEIYLVEQLERRFCQELIKFNDEQTFYLGTSPFNRTFFNTFFSTTLLGEFKMWIFESIKKSGKPAIIEYLTLSLEQFSSYKPDNRKQAIFDYYFQENWKDKDQPSEETIEFHKKVYLMAFEVYGRYYPDYKQITEKFLLEFKAGIIGNSENFQAVSVADQQKEKITYRDFDHFIKLLEYNYPYDTATLSYIYKLKDDIGYVKREILKNQIELKPEEKIPYLNYLKVRLEPASEHVFAEMRDLEWWLRKYDITLEQIFNYPDTKNELYQILQSKPPTFQESMEKGFNPDTEQIQQHFYNYYYGEAISEVLEFIEEQINSLTPGGKESPKLKTNLSVPELAFLFQQLNELKPGIFDIKSKAELQRFISNNFISKGSDSISTDKLKRFFSNPEVKAAEFWTKTFLYFAH